MPVVPHGRRFARDFRTLDIRGCRIGQIIPLLLRMKRDTDRVRKDVAAHRARQIAAGRIALTTYVPTDLLEQIDRIKEQRGVNGRAPIIEEALRLLIKKEARA